MVFSDSSLFDYGDVTLELSFVKSKAQAQRLGEARREGMEVDQVVRGPHL